jgi:hypothetical protein
MRRPEGPGTGIAPLPGPAVNESRNSMALRRRPAPSAASSLLAVFLVSCSNQYSVPAVNPDVEPAGSSSPPVSGEAPVVINEVMVENRSTLPDEKGRFLPWVELYNPTDQPVDLCNVPFSGDPADSARWRIPCRAETVVPAKGFLVIFLDGDPSDASDLHANFTLSPGAPVQLTLNRGSQTFFYYDDIGPDASVGRFPDGATRLVVARPTPGSPNRPPDEPPDALFVRGDVNGNGLVNVSDLALLIQLLSGGKTLPPCQDRLDLNDDGLLDAEDVAYLKAFLFSSGPKPPAPFPTEGADPTPDSLPCNA